MIPLNPKKIKLCPYCSSLNNISIAKFVFFTLISLLSIRFYNNIESKGTYVPAKYDGVDLIPGKVEVEK